MPAARTTRYLGLRIPANASSDAAYNLERLDLIGSLLRHADDGVARFRAQTDVLIEPDASAVGGAGSAGTVTLGHEGNDLATLLLKGVVNLSVAAGLLDQASGGTKYLRLKYKSDVSGSADTSADRALSIDPQGADRSLTLAGNLSLAADLILSGAYATTLAAQQSGTYTLPDQAAGTLVSRDSTDTLENKTLSAATLSGTTINSGILSGGTVSGATISGAVLDADANSVSNIDNSDIKAAAAIAVSKLAAITASRAVATDASGFIEASATTATELGYLHGVSSAVQDQIDGKAATDLSNLTISNLAAGDLLYATSATALARLAAGSNGAVLRMTAGSPAWSTAAGSGDVSGPGAAVTDNGLVRWDGTAGTLVQNSAATLDDAGALAISSLTVGSLAGVLKGTAGAVSGSATTSDLVEGSNLYHTDERVDDRVAALLQDGTGIAWTYDDTANTLTPAVSLAPFDTGDLLEGSNLYYTNERADARIALQAGAAGGLATLDGGGKVPVAQLPSSLFTYEGVWDASANTPTLADGTGDAGQVYRVGTAGSQDLGSGSISFEVGDYAIHNGAAWEKSDTTDAVASVNGYFGVVTIAHSDLADKGTNDHAAIDAHLAASTAHGVTGALVGTTDTQTLSAKTLTAPTIDDYFDVNEESAPGTPSAGAVRVYAKTDKKLYLKNSDGTESAVGSGAGEKNYITGASTSAGWTAVGDLALSTTTTAAELPREYTTGSGIKIVADADTQSTADYVYIDFSLDDVDLSKKLKIQWSQKVIGTYTSGQLAVGIAAQSDRTTFLHTPITSDIPSADGVFTTSFDSSTTAALSLVIRATGDMTTDGGIVISDVVVGPGTQPQGAVVGEWQSYTFTKNSWGSAGTLSQGSYWRRVGESMEVIFNWRGDNTASGATGSSISISIPSGYTIDFTKIPAGAAASPDVIGEVIMYGMDGGAATYSHHAMETASSTTVRFTKTTSGGVFTNTDLNNARDMRIYGRYTIPIAEWAGAGTVNLAQNDVEYASNSDATSGASNTTAFVYGPGGSQFPNGAVGTEYTRDVQFQAAIQPTDKISVEYSSDSGVTWISPGESNDIVAFSSQGSVEYGIRIVALSSTSVRVKFCEGGRQSNNATYANNGAAWSDIGASSTYKWRVRKISGGQAVGFGLAANGRSGLIDYYQTDTNTAALSGATTTPTVTLTATRIGNMVTLVVTNYGGVTKNGSSGALSLPAIIPSWARPTAQTYVSGYGKQSGTTGWVINTNGNLDMYADAWGNIASSASTGLDADVAFSYVIR